MDTVLKNWIEVFTYKDLNKSNEEFRELFEIKNKGLDDGMEKYVNDWNEKWLPNIYTEGIYNKSYIRCFDNGGIYCNPKRMELCENNIKEDNKELKEKLERLQKNKKCGNQGYRHPVFCPTCSASTTDLFYFIQTKGCKKYLWNIILLHILDEHKNI